MPRDNRFRLQKKGEQQLEQVERREGLEPTAPLDAELQTAAPLKKKNRGMAEPRAVGVREQRKPVSAVPLTGAELAALEVAQLQAQVGRRTDLLTGVVTQVHAVQWDVQVGRETLRCVVKRSMRDVQGLPVVGDEVSLEPPVSGMSRIVLIHPRRQVLRRPDVHLGMNQQLLASNVDQVMIVASVANPALKPGLIDRYLVAAWKESLTPILVITKLDLQVDLETLESLAEFEALNVLLIQTSVHTGYGMDKLLEALTGHNTVLVGLSGVGKTSLARKLLQDETLVIRDVSETTGKGRHTTSSARMLSLPEGRPGYLIDMPGQRVFGLTNILPDDLLKGFPELQGLEPCQYTQCSHMHEEGCSVLEAAENKQISERRLEAFYRIQASLNE